MLGYCKYTKKNVLTEADCYYCDKKPEEGLCECFTEKTPDLIVRCRKCEHKIYLEDWHIFEKIDKLVRTSCPTCGEEGYNNWIILGLGFFEDWDGEIIEIEEGE